MTFTDGSDFWRELPNATIETDQRQQQAQQWGAQARAELASEWAKSARNEITQSLPPGFGFDPSNMGAGETTAVLPATEAVIPPSSPPLSPIQQVSPAPSSPLDEVQPGLPQVRGSLNDISQFGQPGLSYDEALAACGPAAAVRLASIFGNNIPLKAALDAAKEVGWTSGGGMNGIGNQKRLLDKLGIPATLDVAPSLDKIISDAQSGNPVTISTPNHYFTVSGYDPQTGRLFVGESGKVYRGGSEWLTFDQIRRLGAGINGALFVDAPTSPTPSIAALETGQTQRYEGSQPAVPTPIGFEGMINQAWEAVQGVAAPVGEAASGAIETISAMPQVAGQKFEDIINTARQAVGYTEPTQPVQTPGFGFDPSNMQPGVAPGQDIPLRQDVRDLGQQAQPTVFDTAGQFLQEGGTSKPIGEALRGAGQSGFGQNVFKPALQIVAPYITEGGEEPPDLTKPMTTRQMAEYGLSIGGIEGPAKVAGKVAGEAVHGLTINLPKYIPEEVQAVIKNAYDANPALFDEARRGVVSDDAVRELAERTGSTVGRIVSQWKPGQAKNAETILALRESLNSTGQEVLRAQNALRATPDSADALNAVTEALTKHAAIQEAVTGVTAEAGRALRQFRQPVTGQQFAVQQLQRIAKATKMTPEELAKHLADVDLTDPTKVANLARTLTQHTFGDKLTALWYFNLLSSPVTHIKNAVSNALVVTSRPLESTASAIVDVGRAAVTRTPRERYFGEVPAQIVGMRAGLSDGVRSAYQIMRRGFSEAELTTKPELATKEPFRGRLADLTVNVPGRALRASDVFFRSVNKSASIYADAYRLASQEGKKGQALLDDVAARVANPTKEMLERADKEAAYRVFQQDGTFVQKMGSLRQDVPALRYLIPFIQTPFNISKYALERTPLAFGKIATEVVTPAGRTALREKGGGDLSDRIARATLGGATLLTLTEYAKQGNLVGAAPIDPAEKDAFYRQGRQPYSMRNPVTGEWFSYAGLQPFTTIFAAAAEMAKMQKQSPDLLTGAAVTALALARATLDQPWTDGLSESLDFMSGARIQDPQDALDAAGKYAARQAGSLEPAVMRWLARATDPTIREPSRGLEGVPQTLAAGAPGLTDTAPAKQTAFGRESQRGISGVQTLNPLASSQPNNDPVEQELARLQLRGYDVQPGFVGKSFNIGTEKVDLSTAERREYQEAAGMLAYELLATAMASREWQGLADVGKAKTVERLVERAREATRNQLSVQPAIRQRAIDSRQKRLAGATP